VPGSHSKHAQSAGQRLHNPIAPLRAGTPSASPLFSAFIILGRSSVILSRPHTPRPPTCQALLRRACMARFAAAAAAAAAATVVVSAADEGRVTAEPSPTAPPPPRPAASAQATAERGAVDALAALAEGGARISLLVLRPARAPYPLPRMPPDSLACRHGPAEALSIRPGRSCRPSREPVGRRAQSSVVLAYRGVTRSACGGAWKTTLLACVRACACACVRACACACVCVYVQVCTGGLDVRA
jgi:hypothetical protein